jgi:hypothetical protein
VRVERIHDAVLYLADCRDVLPSIAKTDAVVLDPPFEMWGQFDAPVADTTIAFCAPPSRREVERLLGSPRAEIVWHFEDGRWVSPTLPRVTHDYIYVYGKTGDADVGEAQEEITQRKGKSSIGRDVLGDRVYTAKARKHLNSVQIFPRNMSGPLGAWGKPEPLMYRLIEWSGAKTVLDPFMGGGTTGAVCARLGVRFVGVESNPEHFEISCKRIAAAYSQPDLFIAEKISKPIQEAML